MKAFVFAKGHATGNDFVLIKDRNGAMALGPDEVRWICDRRLGLGADGVLRAVKAEFVPEWSGNPDLWFMDCRNADGSVAQTCGNGLRLFVRYLIEEDLVPRNEVFVATRAGQRNVWELFDGRLRTTMGPLTLDDAPTWVRLGDQHYEALGVEVGHRQAVVLLDDLAELMALELAQPRVYDEARFPGGVCFAVALPTAPDLILTRLVDPGPGGTYSYGAEAVAVSAVVARARCGEALGDFCVSGPGGDLDVRLSHDQAYLTGPAVVVARGEAALPG